MNEGWRLAWHYARCEIRGSVGRFRVFLVALLLGVAAIGAVGSVADSMRAGIDKNARSLLGGDFELSSRHIPPDAELLAVADSFGQRSNIIQMRAMVEASKPAAGRQRKLVELKAVDSNYPLVGDLKTDPEIDKGTALGALGAIAAPSLLRALDVNIGDRLRLGGADITITAALVTEPDQSVSFIGFGPRLIISHETLAATGLATQGAFITYRSRIRLHDQQDRKAAEAALQQKTMDSHVRLRGLASAGGGFNRFVERAEMFLMLVGLTALLIGGLGVSGAVRAWLLGRINVIATLKCIGAPSQFIFKVYFLQVTAIAAIGVAGGVVLAAAAPFIAAFAFQGIVSVPLETSVHPLPLLRAAAFGFLTTFVFALWPLSRARHIKAGHLFRSLMTMPEGQLSRPALAGIMAGCGGLLALALNATGNLVLAGSFIAVSLAAIALLSGLAGLLSAGLRMLPAPHYVPAHLALSAVRRRGSPLQAIMVAFGLGLSVLVAVILSQHNLVTQLNERALREAPDWFFIDIQPHQIQPFIDTVTRLSPDTAIEKTPMLRGRVIALNDIPASQLSKQVDSAWIVRGDRALTWQPHPPEDAKIVRGDWWPEDYQGPPLVSVTQEMAEDYNLSLGDMIKLNILGRTVQARIANTRHVEWESFRINFVFILSPGLLEGAPHSWLATTRSPTGETASQIEQALTDQFANISSISVQEAVKTVERVLGLLGTAVKLTAGVTLVSGLAVLAGTVAASEAQRLADSMILKIVGATRRDIIIAWILEYSLLAVLTGCAATVIGTGTSWALFSFFIKADYALNPGLAVLTAFAGAGVTVCLGLFGAMRTLGVRPAAFLRETI